MYLDTEKIAKTYVIHNIILRHTHSNTIVDLSPKSTSERSNIPLISHFASISIKSPICGYDISMNWLLCAQLRTVFIVCRCSFTPLRPQLSQRRHARSLVLPRWWTLTSRTVGYWRTSQKKAHNNSYSCPSVIPCMITICRSFFPSTTNRWKEKLKKWF